jgi:hypothetical protein
MKMFTYNLLLLSLFFSSCSHVVIKEQKSELVEVKNESQSTRGDYLAFKGNVNSLRDELKAQGFESSKTNKSKPNISKLSNVLFLSFCSVSTSYLPFFGKNNLNLSQEDLPNLSKIFNQSFLFTNAFTDLSWSNARRYAFLREWRKIYGINNRWEEPIQDWEQDGVKATFVRIPGKEDVTNMYNEYFTDDRLTYPFEKIDEVLNEVIKRRKDQNHKRFIMLHFKIMHYPYLSSSYLNNSTILDETFTKEELDLIKEYLKKPESYPDKYSFFQMTFGDEKFKKLYFNKEKQYVAFATDVGSVETWKKSKNFNIDFSILVKSYKLRLRDFDRLVGKLWEYYKTIEDDTALVLGGDHGESLLEHDYISHGTIPYDEVLKFFQSVHFPGQKNKVVYDQQISQKSIGLMIEDIALGTRNEKKFIKEMPLRIVDKYIYGFSCAGDIASVRDIDGWKFIYYIPEDRYSLFNLKTDPDEKIDLSADHEELVMQYKTQIMDHISRRVVSSDLCFR